MKIEILGTGCAKCQKTGKLVEEVVKEEGIKAEVEYVKKLKEIAARGVMLTPAVIIDGEVKCEGKVPSREEVKSWL